MYGTQRIEGLLALWEDLPRWSGAQWPELEAALRRALARWRAAQDDQERADAILDLDDALKRRAPEALKRLDALDTGREAYSKGRSYSVGSVPSPSAGM